MWLCPEPSHAEEVALAHPTLVVVAGAPLPILQQVQMVFSNSYFRVYTNTDLIGVEVGGAVKNVIALCAGVLDGLGLGDNAKAALMTRGLAEITRLGVAMGAKATTFFGLAGMGDLIVTCTSRHSRNYRAGVQDRTRRPLPAGGPGDGHGGRGGLCYGVRPQTFSGLSGGRAHL